MTSELFAAIGAFVLGGLMCLAGKGIIPLSTKELQDEMVRRHGKRIFWSGILLLFLGVGQLISYLR